MSLRDQNVRAFQSVGIVERLAGCDTCHAKAGVGCRSPFGTVTTFVHKGRLLTDGTDPTKPRHAVPGMETLGAKTGRPDLDKTGDQACRQCGRAVAVPAWLGAKWSGWCSPTCMEKGEGRGRSA